jgi:hypothetical protein
MQRNHKRESNIARKPLSDADFAASGWLFLPLLTYDSDLSDK